MPTTTQRQPETAAEAEARFFALATETAERIAENTRAAQANLRTFQRILFGEG